jgi:hypothetical protein
MAVKKVTKTGKNLKKSTISSYDSYRTPAEDWAEIASPNGSETIRGTPVDALLIGFNFVTD